ncbi:hypothetical protein TNIN_108741 [Trichonephila inaurata madagascariensis]|uniref:Uncharacterized protein n=1 Tax=Trichonephila inaurata madagascariensis TaxID=2747483 RepID=A0A8X6X1D6_9ARAC|nr:hypothetical protein TNIN_108741 [Trichonephila inaurata madagascariensis]
MTHEPKWKGKLLLKLFSLPLFRETFRRPADPEMSRKRVDRGTRAKEGLNRRKDSPVGIAKGGGSVRMTQERRSRVGRSTVADVILLAPSFGRMGRGVEGVFF